MKIKILKSTIYCYFMAIFCISAFANTPPKAVENVINSTLTIFDKLQQENVEVITITLPIDSLILNKNTNKSFAGSFTYNDKLGVELSKSIMIKPRGKSRRRHCSFPPLKIAFSKDNLRAYGLRSKHRSLKLVTHCNSTANANDKVLKEYLTYKIYNKLTENSLQVQLLQINYKDSNSDKTLTYYGYLLEDIDELAERLGGVESNIYGKSLAEFVPTNTNYVTLFQFMIGNEDWEIPNRRNVRYVHLQKENKFLLIPYDFDMTGLVAAEYAKPNVNLGMRTVTQRLFMGQFVDKSNRKNTVNHFLSKKEEIYQLINDCEALSPKHQLYMSNYLDSFFTILTDTKLLDRAIPVGKIIPEKTDIDGTM